jgi:hypothetical protein
MTLAWEGKANDDPIYPAMGSWRKPFNRRQSPLSITPACAGPIYCGASASRFGACSCHLEVELLE